MSTRSPSPSYNRSRSIDSNYGLTRSRSPSASYNRSSSPSASYNRSSSPIRSQSSDYGLTRSRSPSYNRSSSPSASRNGLTRSRSPSVSYNGYRSSSPTRSPSSTYNRQGSPSNYERSRRSENGYRSSDLDSEDIKLQVVVYHSPIGSDKIKRSGFSVRMNYDDNFGKLVDTIVRKLNKDYPNEFPTMIYGEDLILRHQTPRSLGMEDDEDLTLVIVLDR